MKALLQTGPGPWLTTLIVAGFLVLFAILSFTAELGKSATFDEPLHAVGAMVHRNLGDFRINPEDPALFGWWASLLQPHDALKLDPTSPDYQVAWSDNFPQWAFTLKTLYPPDGAAAADRFLNRSRIMFLLLGVILGALIARWAYEVGSGYAAIIASGFFAFDPNFLAHSVLIKSDVPLALVVTVMGYCIWRFGLTGQWRWLAAAILASALAPNVKLNGVLCAPALLGALFIRSLMAEPWRIARGKYPKVVIGLAAMAIAGVGFWLLMSLIMWSTYSFRYSAMVGGASLPSASYVSSAGERAGTLPVRLDLWLQAHHLLPEPWLYGILAQFVISAARPSYLMGTVSLHGQFIYFPLAFLFKTPTATLLAIACVPLSLRWIRSREHTPAERSTHDSFSRRWLGIGLILAPAIFLGIAIASKVNIGLRHILLIYPAIFIALGVGTAALFRRSIWIGATLSGLLFLALAAESFAAYPNYLAFFNTPSGGTAGGVGLLGDSNLDWGQDLPALAEWSRAHPDRKIFLCYFGSASPAAYGIHYVNLPGGWPFAPRGDLTAEPGVLAMSVTNLQGIYLTAARAQYYGQSLNGEQPFAVLNGTIYLYNWPPGN